jgi:hypothetical protein
VGIMASTNDGMAGARTNSFPIVDLANGAPTGIGATNEIVMTWSDARNGLNHEQALVQFSSNQGATWSIPVNGAERSDRPDFPAVAISPNSRDVYLTYDAFLTPWQATTSSPRVMQGVVRHATAGLGGWSTLHRATWGDARASSANALREEFIGDYNSAVASTTFGAAVWNDARNAADCTAIDAYRQSLLTSSPLPAAAPGTACPPTFGNTDIFGWSSSVQERGRGGQNLFSTARGSSTVLLCVFARRFISSLAQLFAERRATSSMKIESSKNKREPTADGPDSISRKLSHLYHSIGGTHR